jgi:hypothetical protein
MATDLPQRTAREADPSALAVPVRCERPGLEPVAVPGCDVCAAADGLRVQARLSGSHVMVRAANRTIATHPHPDEVDR